MTGKYEKAFRTAGIPVHPKPDKSNPLVRAITIVETMRQANYRDLVFEPDKYAAIIGVVFDRIRAGDDDVQASATACILMRPSKTREEATSGRPPIEQGSDGDSARNGSGVNNEEGEQ